VNRALRLSGRSMLSDTKLIECKIEEYTWQKA
jgi:hypothetical protein